MLSVSLWKTNLLQGDEIFDSKLDKESYSDSVSECNEEKISVLRRNKCPSKLQTINDSGHKVRNQNRLRKIFPVKHENLLAIS